VGRASGTAVAPGVVVLIVMLGKKGAVGAAGMAGAAMVGTWVTRATAEGTAEAPPHAVSTTMSPASAIRNTGCVTASLTYRYPHQSPIQGHRMARRDTGDEIAVMFGPLGLTDARAVHVEPFRCSVKQPRRTFRPPYATTTPPITARPEAIGFHSSRARLTTRLGGM